MNTTNPNLNLSQGAVSHALLKGGGGSLQEACSAIAPIGVGEVAVTSSGNLPCKHVFHTVLPAYKTNSNEAIKVCVFLLAQYDH